MIYYNDTISQLKSQVSNVNIDINAYGKDQFFLCPYVHAVNLLQYDVVRLCQDVRTENITASPSYVIKFMSSCHCVATVN